MLPKSLRYRSLQRNVNVELTKKGVGRRLVDGAAKRISIRDKGGRALGTKSSVMATKVVIENAILSGAEMLR